ncbi:hypothetical protein PMAYCL1PPCAC_05357, partial [Pristionchus mayeri]
AIGELIPLTDDQSKSRLLNSPFSRDQMESTPLEQKLFQCLKCDKRLSTYYILKCHMTICTGEKACSHCKSSFRSRYGLNRHMLNVHNKKPYACLT